MIHEDWNIESAGESKAPSGTSRTIASTVAKIGRSMKKLLTGREVRCSSSTALAPVQVYPP
jgi:hypothetical protein